MKESNAEIRMRSPEIEAILDTATNERGERMFKIAWKQTWEFENCLQNYQTAISKYWNNISSNKERTKSGSFCNKMSNCENDEDQSSPENRADINSDSKTKYENSEKRPDLKRRPTFNLENIVTKLKKSKTAEEKEENTRISCTNQNNVKDILASSSSIDKNDNISLDSYPSPTYDDYSKTSQKTPSPTSFPNVERNEALRTRLTPSPLPQDERISKISPTPNHDLTDFNEKSSFLCQLEEKDDIYYLNTLSMTGKQKMEYEDEFENKSVASSHSSTTTKTNHIENICKDNKQLKDLIAQQELASGLDFNDTADKIPEAKCEKCNKRFYRRSQLIRHLSNHVIHECFKCNAVFYCVRKYKRHLATHETYPCEFCDEEFYEASAWYKHRAKHTMIECSSCDTVFYNKAALLKHRLDHMQFICPICHSSFSDLNYWLPHRAFHGKGYGNSLLSPIIKCRECHAGFPTQDSFMKHVCLFGKRSRDKRRHLLTKQDISDLIGVDTSQRI